MVQTTLPIDGVAVNKSITYCSTESFCAVLKNFQDFGTVTNVESKNGIDYFVNEFWTARQRKANRIHEISYRACFKPQLPRFFISRLTHQDDIVYDPFMGRGTTPIEAALHNRIPYGNDTNPLSRALTEPRINPPSLLQIAKRLQEIPWSNFTEYEFDDLLVFYHPDTLCQIEGLRNWLINRQKSNQLDRVDKWIRMVAINRLTGHSPGFFSVYTLPPNQAVSVARQEKINRNRNQRPEPKDIAALILKKSKRLLSSNAQPLASRHLLLTKQAHETQEIPAQSVALTVTSPPFLDTVNYEYDNWLRCWFLGVDAKSVKISQLKNVDDWTKFIAATLTELARLTRMGGYVAFEVGEVRYGEIKLEDLVIEAAGGLNFKILGVMINQQNFTKTSNVWGIDNNAMGTNSNRIVIFQRI